MDAILVSRNRSNYKTDQITITVGISGGTVIFKAVTNEA